MAPPSRSWPWPRPSSGSPTAGSSRPSTAACSAPPRRPRAIQRGLLERAYAAFPPAGPPTYTDEAALLEACRIPVHAVPGDPMNLKVTLPGDLERAEAALVRRDAGRRRPGSGSASAPTAIRSGPARRLPWAASRSTARRDSMATPTVTSPSTRSPTRCSGRAAWATWGASSRPARRRPPGSPARTCSGRSWPGSRPPATGLVDRPDDRRRPATPRRSPRRDARRDRGYGRPRARPGQRQGIDRQPRGLGRRRPGDQRVGRGRRRRRRPAAPVRRPGDR